MVAVEIFRGGVSRSNGARAVIAVVFDEQRPRELNVKAHFMHGNDQSADFDVWFADSLATTSTPGDVLKTRARDIAHAVQFEFTSRGNGAPTLFIEAEALPSPPLTLTRGVKVQVRSADADAAEWRLGKVSRARQDGTVNVQYLDASKEYSVRRSRLRVMGRYRAGQYKWFVSADGPGGISESGALANDFAQDERARYHVASVKIQTVYRSHLARSVLQWLRSMRGGGAASAAGASHSAEIESSLPVVVNSDPTRVPPQPMLPPLSRPAPPGTAAPKDAANANIRALESPRRENNLEARTTASLSRDSPRPSSSTTSTSRNNGTPRAPPNSPAIEVDGREAGDDDTSESDFDSGESSSSVSSSSVSSSSEESDSESDLESPRRIRAESKHQEALAQRTQAKRAKRAGAAPVGSHVARADADAAAAAEVTTAAVDAGGSAAVGGARSDIHVSAATPEAPHDLPDPPQRHQAPARSPPRRRSAPAAASFQQGPKHLEEESAVDVANRIGSSGKLHVFSVTFNAHNKGAQAIAGDVLTHLLRPGFEMYCLSFQDLRMSGAALREALRSVMPAAYIELRAVAMHKLHMFVFVHASLLPLVEDVQSDHVFFGVNVSGIEDGSASDRVKGAVAISFRLCGSSFVFVNSHFKGNPLDDAARDANFHEINVRFKLPLNKLQTTTPIAKRFDFAWWMGDLNYRVHLGERIADLDDVRQFIKQGDIEPLLARDGLLTNRFVFDDYKEMPITFPPTFRFDEASGAYSDKSVPSWTDRILVKKDQPKCVGVAYHMLDSVRTSVHRPVFTVHAVELAGPDEMWSIWHSAHTKFMNELSAERAQEGAGATGPHAGAGSGDLARKKVGKALGKARLKANKKEVSIRLEGEAGAATSRACSIQ